MKENLAIQNNKSSRLWKEIVRHKSVYLLLAIPFTYYIIFKYIPIWNAQIAFKEYWAVQGVNKSPWIGLWSMILGVQLS